MNYSDIHDEDPEDKELPFLLVTLRICLHVLRGHLVHGDFCYTCAKWLHITGHPSNKEDR